MSFPRITRTAILNARTSTWTALADAARRVIESVEGPVPIMDALSELQEAVEKLAACDPGANPPPVDLTPEVERLQAELAKVTTELDAIKAAGREHFDAVDGKSKGVAPGMRQAWSIITAEKLRDLVGEDESPTQPTEGA